MDSLVGERRITYDARGLAEPHAEAPRVSEIDGDFFSSSARSARIVRTSCSARPGARSGTRDSTISRSRSADG